MRVPDYIASYKSHLANLIEKHGREEAMQLIVGGEYDQIVKLERSALIDLGLKRNHSLVAVSYTHLTLPTSDLV